MPNPNDHIVFRHNRMVDEIKREEASGLTAFEQLCADDDFTTEEEGESAPVPDYHEPLRADEEEAECGHLAELTDKERWRFLENI